MYASVNWVSIGWDNGFSPVRRRAIAWTNTDSFSNWPFKFKFKFKFKKVYWNTYIIYTAIVHDMTVPRCLQTLSTRCKQKCIKFRYSETSETMKILEAMKGLWVMGPLSGVLIWKILYWFGDEDLVIWEETLNQNTIFFIHGNAF